MILGRYSTLLLAAVLDSPALWQAFVTHEMDYMSALTRYLVAVVVAAAMLAMLRGLANGYLRGAPAPGRAAGEPANPQRRRTDGEEPTAE
jgi:hypothetical protein